MSPPEPLRKPNRTQGRRIAKVAFWIAIAPVVLLALAWASLALWFDGPSARPFAACRGCLPGHGRWGFGAGPATAARARPCRPHLVAGAGLVAAHCPSNDRDWQPDVSRRPSATFAGDRVTIHNVRDFDYRSETDFTERWENRTYDLNRIRGADLLLSYWGPTLIAHTIMNFEFEDGQHLPISIETRKEKGETYSALRGFFRQYELYYVVADERDVVRLRTNYRGEQVFLYRLRGTPERARAALQSYLDEVNRLAGQPQWYNALIHNCTTTIRTHVQEAGIHNPGTGESWRMARATNSCTAGS